MCPLDSLMRQD